MGDGRQAVQTFAARLAQPSTPGCVAIYRQPLFYGLNFGMSRYERCGACGKWHWVTPKDLAAAGPACPASKS